ncbi:MAG: hypothetical protein CVT49_15540 [candidate division Zixibacteria bacterium HGW-Zixibacteria-1]|nr:MAG: hypothetical protein CVT49_15540 [candidate division Zixibacteria bacterium HGW-Zixibacteria-1]
MDILTNSPFEFKVFVYLSGLIAAALFFTMAGIRDLRTRRFEGFLYITLAAFFIFAHLIFIMSSGDESSILGYINNISLTGWIIILFAPALISLYVLFGLFNFIRLRFFEGFIKIFIGTAMVILLYTLGHDWPELVKVLVILICSIVWFNFELSTVEEYG